MQLKYFNTAKVVHIWLKCVYSIPSSFRFISCLKFCHTDRCKLWGKKGVQQHCSYMQEIFSFSYSNENIFFHCNFCRKLWFNQICLECRKKQKELRKIPWNCIISQRLRVFLFVFVPAKIIEGENLALSFPHHNIKSVHNVGKLKRMSST